MKRTAGAVLATFATLTLACGGVPDSEFGIARSELKGGAAKVMICHYPPGNPSNAHTLRVGEPAVAAHVALHGDTLGPCEPATPPAEPEELPPPAEPTEGTETPTGEAPPATACPCTAAPTGTSAGSPDMFESASCPTASGTLTLCAAYANACTLDGAEADETACAACRADHGVVCPASN
jgi:hypothetical protein